MFGRYLGCVSHPQSDQPESQQGAHFGAALRWRHLVGREWIGALHVSDCRDW